MRRPLTEQEQVIERKKLVIVQAMLVGRIVLTGNYSITGMTRWYHDNVAGSECYGKQPHYHTHYHTNHERVR